MSARQASLSPPLNALRLWLGTLLVIAGAGCSAPSLHSIVTADATVDDVGLAGPWVDEHSGLFVRVQRKAPGTYVVSASADNGPLPDVRYAFDVSLVELGGRRYADMTVAMAEADEPYGEMLLHPHVFMKIRRRGDRLTLWSLDAQIMQAATSLQGTVLPGDGSGTFVLTSETAALQRYVTEHADDADLYEPALGLRRVRAARGRTAPRP